MAAMRKSLPESLAKPINVNAAQPSLLRIQMSLPPDESDIMNHIVSERLQRIEAVDVHFDLDANAPGLPEQRVKAIVNIVYGVPADSPDWWSRFFLALMVRHIPGFSIDGRGRPRKWTFDDFAALHKDIRALEARYPDLKGEIFYRKLRSCHPKTWGQYEIPALRKASSNARALAQGFPEPTVSPERKVTK